MSKELRHAIVAGVTKSGTTSIFHWMSDHTEVCVADKKEMHYFADKGFPVTDKAVNYHTLGAEGYQRCFSRCSKKNVKLYFDASPSYYDEQSTPLQAIPTIKPCPKIILVLRKPSDRIRSFFDYVQNNSMLTDKNYDFYDTINLIMKKSRAELADDKFLSAVRSFYETCHYINFTPKWIDAFGGENVKVMLFESMKTHRIEFMKGISDFVGINRDFWDNYAYPRRNTTFSVKNKFLHKLARKVYEIIPESGLRESLRKLYTEYNTEVLKEQSERDVAALITLDDEFADSNKRLSEYLGADLSAWGAKKKTGGWKNK